ncbi:hypothetical protein BS329_41090 [Amycolatopsis coloradensis]|uniref:Uncharacterized protein n=1 Tax=Amycolatopsis coloradensis TaxID=76021 RepID=A0A1R0KD67_9PSEU|nr:hypothetical protein [Amycolatopsis coloradensis]OLZ42884.1 hypothetical protein BS329_41090 [Amycolatopsis coloradensis]
MAIGLAVSACGSADTPDPKPNLVKEYWESSAVKNDRLPGYGAAPEDRQANLAAYYSPEQLLSRLMSVFTCTKGPGSGGRGGDRFDTSCDLSAAVRRAIQEAGGDPQRVSARVVLVKHPDGVLELMTLVIANDKAIDANGETYSGLDQFRAGNDLLDSDDVILVPRELTRVTGDNELVTVYGHTPWVGWPWLLGGGVLVLAVILLLLLIRRKVRRARQRGEPGDHDLGTSS